MTPASRDRAGIHVSLKELLAYEVKGRGFSLLPRRRVVNLLTGRHGSRMRGRGLDFEEIRAYRPGDDIRMLDWRVKARTGVPHTRVFTEERDRSQLIIVDQRASMFFGTKRALKSVVACEIGALAAWRAFGVGDRCGCIVFGDETTDSLRPHRSRRRVLEVLHILRRYNHALTRPDIGNAAMLNVALRHALGVAKHDFIVLIVSDLSGADSETATLVSRLARHNDVLVAPVFDPAERTLPRIGRAAFVNRDGRVEVDTGSAAAAFARSFAERATVIQEGLGGLAIPLIAFSTSDNVAETVRRRLAEALSQQRQAARR